MILNCCRKLRENSIKEIKVRKQVLSEWGVPEDCFWYAPFIVITMEIPISGVWLGAACL